jgi:pimeloyl-ACP methyl ester carboxylesterase
MRAPFDVAVEGGALHGWRTGSGPAVLALHGGPALSYGYLDEMVDELATSFEVATYQQRGLAPSVAVGPYSVDQEVADACSVLSALGWERAWVVGHSWGGHLLLHLAWRRPERLLGGVAVDPLGGVGDGGFGAMTEAFERWRASDERTAVCTARGDDPEATGLVANWPAYFASPIAAPPMPAFESSPEAYAGIMESVRAQFASLEAALGGFTTPLAFVAGQRSPLRPEASSLPTALAIPGARAIVVDGAGHFPWVERPGCVVEALRALALA